ncbi:MAG: hypothetical protein Q7J79_01625 [Gemmatimonadales bacterium]|nr:hypothetical protein [Gemmatimonadales bacterium]
MLRRIRLTLLSAALPFALACGDSSGPGSINLSGTYTGSMTATSGGFSVPGTLTFTLSQSGTSVSGTWTNSFGASGTGTATLSGTTLTLTLTQTNPCAGVFGGSATVQNAGARLSGTFSGSDCAGSATGSFVVNKI